MISNKCVSKYKNSGYSMNKANHEPYLCHGLINTFPAGIYMEQRDSRDAEPSSDEFRA